MANSPSGFLLAARGFPLLAAAIATAVIGSHLPSRAASIATPNLVLHQTRSSPLDLEVAGDVAGLSPGSVGYLTRDDLLQLPQIRFTVRDDTNFSGPTQISGVAVAELLRRLSAHPENDLAVAICDDLYQANYPKSYLLAHQPVLALLINGQEPRNWPKDAEGFGMDIGPYLISHAAFVPSYQVLGHPEKPQVPWGVVRLEFRDETAVLGTIQPRGSHAGDPEVQSGYRLAAQNCFRCHNLGKQGGEKAGRPWLVLSAWASAAPDYFTAYVRNPKSKNARAEMPGNPDYDDATMHALLAYFRTFIPSGENP
jgi:mono/diheme cytochrome c family protein